MPSASSLMVEEDQPQPEQDTSGRVHNDARPRIVCSEDLLEGQREVWIEHGQEMYRLRLTRAGKLHLTK